MELERNGYNPIYERVDTPAAMNAALNREQWDVIICDHAMPYFSAPAALTLLKEKKLDLPFIIVSGCMGEEIAVAAMRAGAHDYLMKHQLARLVPAIERELREASVRQSRTQAEEKLKYLAFYDPLTELPNRTLFLDRLSECIKDTQDSSNDLFAVLFIDLERYQTVKYSLGHCQSEELLVQVARRIKTCLCSDTHLNGGTKLEDRESRGIEKQLYSSAPPYHSAPRSERALQQQNADTCENMVARVGEHQFAILLTDIQSPSDADTRCKAIHQKMKSPFKLNGPVVFANASIGIVLSSIGYDQPEEFLRAADTAMHYAKMQGTEYAAMFDTGMQARAMSRLQLETDLQQAIKLQQLHLSYQPIASLSTGRIIGFEALLRWQHPQRGQVTPSEFIPVAEETGLIIPLGQWVLAEACRRLRIWQEQFPKHKSLSVSVNLSGIQLSTADLLPHIDQLLVALGLSGESLKLEITESILMENAEQVTAVLDQLQERQIQVSIDDFGTGYSSLSYLHRFPINTLKIDRSFISRIEANGKNAQIVRAIVNLAHTLGLDVVAEGVETPEQCLHLQALGCEYGQGYFISRPLDLEAVVALLAATS